jgi:uncharacterized protein (UPF0332 family)
MKAAEFISLAEEMLLEQPTPSRCRSIISRAYYGAFHVAQDLIADLGLKTGHNHGHLQHDYLHSGSMPGRDIGMLLETLHSLRVQADYRLQLKHVEAIEASRGAVADAQRIVRTANELKEEFKQNPSARQAFVDAILAFRTKVNRRI